MVTKEARTLQIPVGAQDFQVVDREDRIWLYFRVASRHYRVAVAEGRGCSEAPYLTFNADPIEELPSASALEGV